MLHIHELERAGIDTSTDIYNTAFRDNRLKHGTIFLHYTKEIYLLLKKNKEFLSFSLPFHHLINLS